MSLEKTFKFQIRRFSRDESGLIKTEIRKEIQDTTLAWPTLYTTQNVSKCIKGVQYNREVIDKRNLNVALSQNYTIYLK